MFAWIEQIRRRFYKLAGRIHGPLATAYRIKWIHDEVTKRKSVRYLLPLGLMMTAFLWGVDWPTSVKTGIGVFLGVLGMLAYGLDLLWDVARAPAPTRRINDPFMRRILSPVASARFELIKSSEKNRFPIVSEIEHLAFSGRSRTAREARLDRISKWLDKADNLAQLIYLNDELVGYSVIIPVSEEQADQFKASLATEWFFNVVKPRQSQQRLTLYAQAIYLKPKFHGDDTTYGLSQSGALNHVLVLLAEYAQLVFGASRTVDIVELVQRTRILADEGSGAGAGFMKNLGFERCKAKTANNRFIWELEFSRPAPEKSPLWQTRRTIAQALNVDEFQVSGNRRIRDKISSWLDTYIGFRL